MKKIPFTKLAEKIGLPEAYFMFWDKLSQEAKDKLTFSDWEKIHEERAYKYFNTDAEILAARKMAVRKMAEMAKTPEEALRAYELTENGSPEEKFAFEKLSQFEDPKKWLEIFEKSDRIYVSGKALSYLKEMIKDFIDLS